MKVTDLDFDLHESFIALTPTVPRDACRLLVLHRESGLIEHRIFRDLPGYLREGDLLILNDTRVLPARLTARKKTGGKIDILLVKELERNVALQVQDTDSPDTFTVSGRGELHQVDPIVIAVEGGRLGVQRDTRVAPESSGQGGQRILIGDQDRVLGEIRAHHRW